VNLLAAKLQIHYQVLNTNFMLKQSLQQKMLQKMSPQQIQFAKLLQLGTIDFVEKVEQELLDNPALEKGLESDEDMDDYRYEKETDSHTSDEPEESYDTWDKEMEDYLTQPEDNPYQYNDDYQDEEQKEIPIATHQTFYEFLTEQARNNIQHPFQLELALHLIGSLEDDGYLRRELKAIVYDLMFTSNISTSEEELEKVLKNIQTFEPSGVAARNLKECLILQLNRKKEEIGTTPNIDRAIEILEKHLEAFTKKHYEKIMRSMKINEVELKNAIKEITKLNPKPGQVSSSNYKEQHVNPDFTVTERDGELIVLLNGKNAPELRISRAYRETLNAYQQNAKDKKLKDSAQYIKQKVEGAKWFIDSIKQRQHTLISTMRSIVEMQKDFFYDGNETSLRPMIMKDIADKIGMDISTISRVANSKYVETSFGIYPLKYFFTEGVSNSEGEEISNREIKKILKDAIDQEDKRKPLTDEALMKILKLKGYNIARRTVAKYREQLNIPVGRLRKEL
jgi:RNA polymerase sigma-54 factor